MNFETEVSAVLDQIKDLLLEKNRKYGDSALNPIRIFSKSDSIAQIEVRIDDKLSRIKSSQGDEDEDVITDLIGYLVLLKIAKSKSKPYIDFTNLPNFYNYDTSTGYFSVNHNLEKISNE